MNQSAQGAPVIIQPHASIRNILLDNYTKDEESVAKSIWMCRASCYH